MAIGGAEHSRGYGRKNPVTGKWEVVSRDVFERDVKNPEQAKAKVESRKVINTRTTGGIEGAGAKNVGKVYRMMGGGGLGGIFGTKNR
jgi:hypothetical protein